MKLWLGSGACHHSLTGEDRWKKRDGSTEYKGMGVEFRKWFLHNEKFKSSMVAGGSNTSGGYLPSPITGKSSTDGNATGEQAII